MAELIGGYVLFSDDVSTNVKKLGLIVGVGAKIWEIIDAYNAVEDYNRALKKELNFKVDLNNNDQLTAGLEYRF